MTSKFRRFFLILAILLSLGVAFVARVSFADDVDASNPRPEIVLFDFEGDDYGAWTVEGDAFGTAPVAATARCGMGRVFNHDGAKLVNSYVCEKRDVATGTMTSPEFEINRDYLTFRIGGGAFPGETGIALIVDGKEFASSTGLFSEHMKGDEGLETRCWDVRSTIGKRAKIAIYDRKAGGDWGHIKVDRIALTDVAPDPETTRAQFANGESKTYDRMIFGQFVEHFHRQVYGGIFEPGSPLSDEEGFRKDVVEALKELRIPIVRWPGGCFVSAYHWIYGVGPDREPTFDKAWRVEDPNLFGTAEFVKWCRMIGAEPYICTNAGTGTPEEMSDWVEYCNLNVGRFGRMRRAHGYEEPFNVKYWSIGNENWGGHEMGAKTVDEWGVFVRESAKLMVNTDHNIKLFAAALPDEGWTLPLLQKANHYLNYVPIHGYWDFLANGGTPSPYLTCMLRSTEAEDSILRTIDVLDRVGVRNRVKIAFDEWNLRGWTHPGIGNPWALDIDARKQNDDNTTYTMADALFAASFLNTCVRYCDDVKIACFSPIVNARGALYVYPGGIVKRPTFHVFKMYSDLLEKQYLPLDVDSQRLKIGDRAIPAVDVLATCDENKTRIVYAIANKDPEKDARVALPGIDPNASTVAATILTAPTPDSYNDVGKENVVVPKDVELNVEKGAVVFPKHSLVILPVERQK